MFIDNKYYKWYKELTAKKDRKLDCYTEKHHIIPKSMGGLNDKDNLVVLTAREHYIAHLLLTKCTTGTSLKSMSYALWNMCNRDKGIRIKSAIQYELLRINHAHFLSRTLSGENNPHFGKKQSAEALAKISASSAAQVHTKERRIKASKRLTGEGNHRYGVVTSDEVKEKIRNHHKENPFIPSEEQINKIREAKEGTYNCFDVVEQKFVRVAMETYKKDKGRYKNNRSPEAVEFKNKRNKK